MQTRTYELGELKVTIEVPDVLIGQDTSPLLTLKAKSDAHFHEMIDHLGGPDKFEVGSYDYLMARGNIVVFLHPPSVEREIRPAHPLIAEFEQRKAELAPR